jgi:hypothetical protein
MPSLRKGGIESLEDLKVMWLEDMDLESMVRRPLRPATLLFLTGISICDVCSCDGILRAQRTRVGHSRRQRTGLYAPGYRCAQARQWHDTRRVVDLIAAKSYCNALTDDVHYCGWLCSSALVGGSCVGVQYRCHVEDPAEAVFCTVDSTACPSVLWSHFIKAESSGRAPSRSCWPQHLLHSWQAVEAGAGVGG